MTPLHRSNVCPTGLYWLMRDGGNLQRGVPERGQSTAGTTQTHTDKNTRRAIYPCGTTAGLRPKHPRGGVWQSRAKWILQRKRFKAFSVFQAAASRGFDGLFSGEMLCRCPGFVLIHWVLPHRVCSFKAALGAGRIV